MSVNEKMTALANAVRTKSGTTQALTLDGMTEKINGVFSAFYSYTRGSGNAHQIFYQVPFEANLVSMIIRWGIQNDVMVNKSVFAVFYSPTGNRCKEKIFNSNGTPNGTPQEREGVVTVTSTADGNGTYTVDVYCNGSVFPSEMDYICFLGKIN